MSKELIDAIISNNLSEANDIFKDRMEVIKECKLYEASRSMDIAEGFGGKTREQMSRLKKRASEYWTPEKIESERQENKAKAEKEKIEAKKRAKETAEKEVTAKSPFKKKARKVLKVAAGGAKSVLGHLAASIGE